MAKKIKVGITQGDPNGIGMEIILKALMEEGMTELLTPVLFAQPELVKEGLKLYVKAEPDVRLPEVHFIENPQELKDCAVNVVALESPYHPEMKGKITPEGGNASIEALDRATEALKKGLIEVIVTAPICKENVKSEDFPYSGHTDYLQETIGEGEKALMILFDGNFRVALVTTHIPIDKVSAEITKEKIIDTVRVFDRSLKMDFGIVRPKIAVLSLNPHSGDGGVIGNEEDTVIRPALKELSEEGLLVFGPYASDGFFSESLQYKFDGVVAMYHDQGLAPFKTLCGKTGVNFTAGLPYVRTSPDHGTAFEIAGKGVADEKSMRNAIYEAIDICRRRRNFKEAAANPLRQFVHSKPDPENHHNPKPKNQQPNREEE